MNIPSIVPTSPEVTRLQDVITQALAAMDAGEYGTARKILRTGKDASTKVFTGVLAKGQP